MLICTKTAWNSPPSSPPWHARVAPRGAGRDHDVAKEFRELKDRDLEATVVETLLNDTRAHKHRVWWAFREDHRWSSDQRRWTRGSGNLEKPQAPSKRTCTSGMPVDNI